MQNCRIWGTENPHAYIEKLTHPNRVTVWCRFWSRGIIGPFFFENEEWEAVTVNNDRYRAMLNEFLFTKIEEEDIGNIWFQQDGATCYTAGATVDILRPVFEDRIISSRADVVWPHRSSSPIWQIISFILPRTNMVAYTLEQRLEVDLRSTYRRCRFWQKNPLFRWSSFWSWRVCKQSKLSHLGQRKPACIHGKADTIKTSHCLVRILV